MTTKVHPKNDWDKQAAEGWVNSINDDDYWEHSAERNDYLYIGGRAKKRKKLKKELKEEGLSKKESRIRARRIVKGKESMPTQTTQSESVTTSINTATIPDTSLQLQAPMQPTPQQNLAYPPPPDQYQQQNAYPPPPDQSGNVYTAPNQSQNQYSQYPQQYQQNDDNTSDDGDSDDSDDSDEYQDDGNNATGRSRKPRIHNKTRKLKATGTFGGISVNSTDTLISFIAIGLVSIAFISYFTMQRFEG